MTLLKLPAPGSLLANISLPASLFPLSVLSESKSGWFDSLSSIPEVRELEDWLEAEVGGEVTQYGCQRTLTEQRILLALRAQDRPCG